RGDTPISYSTAQIGMTPIAQLMLCGTDLRHELRHELEHHAELIRASAGGAEEISIPADDEAGVGIVAGAASGEIVDHTAGPAAGGGSQFEDHSAGAGTG